MSAIIDLMNFLLTSPFQFFIFLAMLLPGYLYFLKIRRESDITNLTELDVLLSTLFYSAIFLFFGGLLAITLTWGINLPDVWNYHYSQLSEEIKQQILLSEYTNRIFLSSVAFIEWVFFITSVKSDWKSFISKKEWVSRMLSKFNNNNFMFYWLSFSIYFLVFLLSINSSFPINYVFSGLALIPTYLMCAKVLHSVKKTIF